MNKQTRKTQQSQNFSSQDEQSRHHYKYQKNLQEKKFLKNLDRALRSKDYAKLVHSDDY